MAYQYDENQGFRPEGTPPPPPPRKNGVEKNNNDLGSWIFIIVMLSVAWPVGLILLISKLSDSSGRKNRAPRQASAQAADHAAGDENAGLYRQERQDHEDHRRGVGHTGLPGAVQRRGGEFVLCGAV